MNNADMPAMPQERALWVEGIGECPTLATGLTKREHFAILAMQGLLSSPDRRCLDMDYVEIACHSVKFADSLLAELEK